MPRIPIKCPKCGELLEVESEKEAILCPKCGEAISVAKAMELFKQSFGSFFMQEETKQEEPNKKEEENIEVASPIVENVQPTKEEIVLPPIIGDCPKCNAVLYEGDKFCSECGYDLNTPINNEPEIVLPPVVGNCPKCNAVLYEGDKFCGECGFDLTLESNEPKQEELNVIDENADLQIEEIVASNNDNDVQEEINDEAVTIEEPTILTEELETETTNEEENIDESIAQNEQQEEQIVVETPIEEEQPVTPKTKNKSKLGLIIALVSLLVVGGVTTFILTRHNCEKEGHVYGEWIVDTEATCTTSGLQHRDCKYCKEQQKEVIKALGHIVENGICNVCGENPCAYGHTYVNYECTICHDKLDTTGWSQGLRIENGVVRGIGTCKDTNIVIPSYMANGTKVTTIEGWAFDGCSNLTSISIPISVTSIGLDAFKDCKNLISITIPNSVTSIGENTFYGCTKLTSITIPSSVTFIGSSAFSGCSSLTSITIPNSVTTIGNSAFSRCKSLTSITVEPNNKKYDSRDNCNAIIETATNTLVSGCKNTIIPNSVTNIGDNAFYGCRKLSSITIPNSVTSIGKFAFYDCRKLSSITIPSSVTSIGSEAFSDVYCNITYQGTIAQWEAISKSFEWGQLFCGKIVCTDGTINL